MAWDISFLFIRSDNRTENEHLKSGIFNVKIGQLLKRLDESYGILLNIFDNLGVRGSV